MNNDNDNNNGSGGGGVVTSIWRMGRRVVSAVNPFASAVVSAAPPRPPVPSFTANLDDESDDSESDVGSDSEVQSFLTGTSVDTTDSGDTASTYWYGSDADDAMVASGFGSTHTGSDHWRRVDEVESALTSSSSSSAALTSSPSTTTSTSISTSASAFADAHSTIITTHLPQQQPDVHSTSDASPLLPRSRVRLLTTSRTTSLMSISSTSGPASTSTPSVTFASTNAESSSTQAPTTINSNPTSTSSSSIPSPTTPGTYTPTLPPPDTSPHPPRIALSLDVRPGEPFPLHALDPDPDRWRGSPAAPSSSSLLPTTSSCSTPVGARSQSRSESASPSPPKAPRPAHRRLARDSASPRRRGYAGTWNLMGYAAHVDFEGGGRGRAPSPPSAGRYRMTPYPSPRLGSSSGSSCGSSSSGSSSCGSESSPRSSTHSAVGDEDEYDELEDDDTSDNERASPFARTRIDARRARNELDREQSRELERRVAFAFAASSGSALFPEVASPHPALQEQEPEHDELDQDQEDEDGSPMDVDDPEPPVAVKEEEVSPALSWRGLPTRSRPGVELKHEDEDEERGVSQEFMDETMDVFFVLPTAETEAEAGFREVRRETTPEGEGRLSPVSSSPGLMGVRALPSTCASELSSPALPHRALAGPQVASGRLGHDTRRTALQMRYIDLDQPDRLPVLPEDDWEGEGAADSLRLAPLLSYPRSPGSPSVSPGSAPVSPGSLRSPRFEPQSPVYAPQAAVGSTSTLPASIQARLIAPHTTLSRDRPEGALTSTSTLPVSLQAHIVHSPLSVYVQSMPRPRQHAESSLMGMAYAATRGDGEGVRVLDRIPAPPPLPRRWDGESASAAGPSRTRRMGRFSARSLSAPYPSQSPPHRVRSTSPHPVVSSENATASTSAIVVAPDATTDETPSAVRRSQRISTRKAREEAEAKKEEEMKNNKKAKKSRKGKGKGKAKE